MTVNLHYCTQSLGVHLARAAKSVAMGRRPNLQHLASSKVIQLKYVLQKDDKLGVGLLRELPLWRLLRWRSQLCTVCSFRRLRCSTLHRISPIFPDFYRDLVPLVILRKILQ